MALTVCAKGQKESRILDCTSFLDNPQTAKAPSGKQLGHLLPHSLALFGKDVARDAADRAQAYRVERIDTACRARGHSPGWKIRQQVLRRGQRVGWLLVFKSPLLFGAINLS